MTKYNTHTLGCGLRIIHLPSTSQVVYCGFEINAGTRHERPGEEGLAHFCEHMTFKGTHRRKAWHILNALERVGGDLNAFTNKEDTVYYAAILKEHLPRAVDLLCDIVFDSIFPPHELEREAAVVCDEIESYNDTPAELIYDEFENAVFAGHPLGHNILGTAKQLRTYTSADLSRFTARHYRAANMVFFAYGDIRFERLVRLLEKATGGFAIAEPLVDTVHATPTLPMADGRTLEQHRHTHQTHVIVGNRAYSIHDERRMSLYLLNNILGGPGMNARLNLELRERHGLVYTVESSMASYADTGVWSIYFGCDPHDTDRCLRLVRRELDRFANQPLSDARLRAAKKQIKGQIGVACDNREQFALDFGKSFLHYGWEKDVNSLCAHVDAVTASQIQQTASELFPQEKLTTLIFK